MFSKNFAPLLIIIIKCLYSKEIQLKRDLRVDKRKVFLYSINYDSIEALKAETKEKEKKDNPKTSQLLKLLPIGLRSLAKNLAKKESSNPVHQSDNFYVKVIKRILISNINNLKEAPLRNITCIETLSVRELSKLTETDLYDLQKKIAETSNWIKQLSQKFSLALSTKYQKEAKTKLNSVGNEISSCSFIKNGFLVFATLPKKVSWDQKKLEEIYEKMSPEERREFFTVSYTVPEETFLRANNNVQQKLEQARTTTYGNLKVIFENKN